MDGKHLEEKKSGRERSERGGGEGTVKVKL